MSDSTAALIAAVAGPDALGRGVVLAPAADGARPDVPAPWLDAPVLVVDDAVLASPRSSVEVLHRLWASRTRHVIVLACDNDAMRAPQIETRPPHQLPADFTFDRERLHRLVWANTVDLRTGDPRWWHAVKASRLDAGAILVEPDSGLTGDLVLRDGSRVWVDGGPRGPVPGLDLPIVHAETVALGRVDIDRGGPAPTTSDDALAPDQRAAVLHRDGAARIIAPAGSGKTRVLTARLRHLLADRGVPSSLVTAVAYNTRAAEELRERTGGLRANVRTIHSLAWSIVNQVERREVIDEGRVRDHLRRFVTVPKVPNQDPLAAYLEALAEVRLGLRSPELVEASRDDVDGFAEAFPRYRDELARRGQIDFDEQIYRAIEILLTDPATRADVQRRCTHLLVDEFQDLTPAFVLLLRLCASPFLQVFAVGDDDQTIYGHTGATPDYLIDFERHFPAAAAHPLEVNYRCPPAVVQAADTLLHHNKRRVDKTIRSGRTSSDGPADAVTVKRLLVPASAMASRIVDEVQGAIAQGARPDDVAVLARVNASLLAPQIALAEAGLPHRATIDRLVLRRTGLRTALAYLRLAVDPDQMRREDLTEVVGRPARKISGVARETLGRRRSWSLDDLDAAGLKVDGAAAGRWMDFVEDLRLLVIARSSGAGVGRLLSLIRHRIGLGDAMASLDGAKKVPSGSSHGDDLDALDQLAALHDDPATFEPWLTDHLSRPRDPGDAGVVLSTVHRVKGMEWDHVIVASATDGLFPHRLAEGQPQREEERRVFHVALTRARRRVTFVGDKASPSPFLSELDGGASQATGRTRRGA